MSFKLNSPNGNFLNTVMQPLLFWIMRKEQGVTWGPWRRRSRHAPRAGERAEHRFLQRRLRGHGPDLREWDAHEQASTLDRQPVVEVLKIGNSSYLVRVSLARTGRWITRLPHFDRATWSSLPPDLAPERLEQLMVSPETPFGRLRFLAPVAQLSETPARWERPTAPLNHDSPVWLPR